jgi:hypothetical protein
MKVLLVGEYSGVHTDLAAALKKRGVFAATANNGDGFKDYKRDIDLKTAGRNKLHTFLNVVRKFYALYTCIKKNDFDVIQVINPKIFPGYFNNLFYKMLFRQRSKVFLLSCGEDVVVWKAYKSGVFRYYAFDGQLEKDLPKDARPWEDEYWMKFITDLSKKVSAIIPLCVEYKMAYEKYFGKLPFVPLSINCSLPVVYDTDKYEKITIYHGVNKGREGAKGSDIILEALKAISEKYADRVDVRVTHSIPFREYLNVLRKANIVIDQTSCYSVSMNALYSMLSGCVVLGGGEPEYLESIGAAETPVINILPDANDIFDKLSFLIENPEQIESMGKWSVDFVKAYHDVNKNSEKFIKIWEKYPQ